MSEEFSELNNMMDIPDVLHVEICQKADSTLSLDSVRNHVQAMVSSLEEVDLDIITYMKDSSNKIIRDHIESIVYSCSQENETRMKMKGVHLKFHVYRLSQEEAAIETMQYDNEELSVALHWILPSKDFQNLWENLYFDLDVKNNLLQFVETAMTFMDHKVNPNIISCNKVILLHGPPGTGKTSMCRALAQKIVIRLGHRFTHGELVEINSQSLFSKWFSESGKLVMKLFEKVRALLDNPETLVCILIDEIESLAHVRKAGANGIEPTDSIRVVNALLTQLDQMKQYPNVIILTTSNMTEAIDLAFLDRADIKQYINHPTEQAIYKIYSSCINELMKTGLMEPTVLHNLPHVRRHSNEENSNAKESLMLLKLCQESEGLSGRSLRKIPFLAYSHLPSPEKCTLPTFLSLMRLCVKQQKNSLAK